MTDRHAGETGFPSGPTGLWIAISIVIALFMAVVIVAAVIATR